MCPSIFRAALVAARALAYLVRQHELMCEVALYILPFPLWPFPTVSMCHGPQVAGLVVLFLHVCVKLNLGIVVVQFLAMQPFKVRSKGRHLTLVWLTSSTG